MGPLAGVRVVEIAGIGPGPFTAMMLADMGADVIRVDRANQVRGGDPAIPPGDSLNRGRRSVGIDLKSPDGVETLLRLVEHADALIEGFRPGVAERLGFGPDECLARNARLVFGRMTGWGQDGPLAHTAGHDINYISIAGVLHTFAREGGQPHPPINMVGDFGGGGMLLAFGLVCGILSARSTGEGQVVDAAMLDGAATLMSMIWAFKGMGIWDSDRPGTNLLDTGTHFYDTYRTSDDRWISVGAIEPQFYTELLDRLGLAEEELPHQMDKNHWPELKERFAAVIATRTRDEWAEVFEGSDACVAPVLSMDEATRHPHNVERGVFVERDGIVQPAPSPRFSATPGAIGRPPAHAGQHTDEVLSEWLSLDDAEIGALRDSGAVA
ncbi:MAG: CaiB/BaiF CoA-transferase family protein [Microthrixaceae bacterium]